MSKLLAGIGASGALVLVAMSSSAWAAQARPEQTSSSHAQDKPAPKVDDVPAPPMALLFGIGAVGLLWGRRLTAGARKAREQADPSD